MCKDIIISNAKDDLSIVDQVIELGDKNNATLGFMPHEAFIGAINKGHVLIATNVNGKLLGYLMYNIAVRKNIASITHFCICEEFRHKGVANSLFDNFKNIVSHCFYIRVHCRRDYGIDNFWSKLGFKPVSEKNGRGKDSKILTIWHYELGHPTLFSDSNSYSVFDGVKAVIDANVFYEAQKRPTVENQSCHSLLAEWLSDYFLACVTPELLNEINKCKSSEKRKRSRDFFNSFEVVKVDDDFFLELYKDIRTFYPATIRSQDESDIRQLTYTILAGVNIFITQDVRLRSKTMIENHYDIKIYSPTDFLLYLDEFISAEKYRPVKLAGAELKKELVKAKTSESLYKFFPWYPNQKKSHFVAKLNGYLTDTQHKKTWVISDQHSPIALYTLNDNCSDVLNIELLKLSKNKLNTVIAKHLIYKMLNEAAQQNKKYVVISDKSLSVDTIEILKEFGFVEINQNWVKLVSTLVSNSVTFLSDLKNYPLNIYVTSGDLYQFIAEAEKLVTLNTSASLYQLERTFFPLKLTDLDIPTFVIPIKPTWAIQLFDSGLGAEFLFGLTADLMCSIENVYYRSAKPRVVTAPARILWYYTAKKGQSGQKSIAACSYLDEVHIGKPKELFTRFKHLGVYDWEKVKSTAKGIDSDLMAFRFSHTELFTKRIGLNEISTMWHAVGCQFNPVTAVALKDPITFHDFYLQGMN